MEKSGYIITSDGARALDAIRFSEVRFVASLDNGAGFIAFDGDRAVAYQLRGVVGGRVLVTMEPHPDYPPSWPWGHGHPHPAPKRQIGNGSERFSIVRPDGQASETMIRLGALYPDAALALVCGDQLQGDGDLVILVETQGEEVIGADWSGAVSTFCDIRSPVPA